MPTGRHRGAPPGLAGVSAVFTDRHGGVSAAPYASNNLGSHVGDQDDAVVHNRLAVAGARGAPSLAVMNQVHGAGVAVVDTAAGPAPVADSLVTTVPGVALTVQVADCVPLLLAGRQGEVAAAVHAGRPGLLAGVVAATLRVIADLGIRPDSLCAWIGPAIGGCCYEVPAEMRAEVCATVPQAWSTTRWGTPSVDLRPAVAAQLLRAGLRDVHLVGPCTYESEDHFSYRRDGVTGRFAGIVELLP